MQLERALWLKTLRENRAR